MKKAIVPAIIGGVLFLANEAKAPPQFSGKVWRDIYGNSADSADVIITHPNGIDTIMTKVSRGGIPAYWARAAPDPWNLGLGDTVDIKVIDTNGEDSTKTWRDVTSPTGGNLVIDLFTDPDEPNGDGQSLLIKKVWDTVDSVDAKCWVKGKPDTLNGRFRINTGFYNISFNAKNFPVASQPQLGDSIFFKMTTGSYKANSKGVYQEFFFDGDTFPSCSLKIVGIEGYKQEKPYQDYQIFPTITNGNVKIYGVNAFSVYNSAGQRVDKEKNNSRTYFINGPDGVYFLKPEEPELPTKKIIKKK